VIRNFPGLVVFNCKYIHTYNVLKEEELNRTHHFGGIYVDTYFVLQHNFQKIFSQFYHRRTSKTRLRYLANDGQSWTKL
jgi:hypothetical protein